LFRYGENSKISEGNRVRTRTTIRMPCTGALHVFIISWGKRVFTKLRRCFLMVSLNSRDLGMDHEFRLTGTNEREIMRNFIEYTESELKIPYLTADTIYRVKMAIKK
jgi:predicted small metal-binding protein